MGAKSGRALAIGGLIFLAIWLVAALLGADYFADVLDPQRIEKGIGWPVALVVLGVVSTTIWFGMVVLASVIAWKRWSRRPGDPNDRGKSSAEP